MSAIAEPRPRSESVRDDCDGESDANDRRDFACVTTALTSAPPPRSLYRMSIEKYEAMVRSGVFTNRDRLELIEGILVEKMTQHPPHAVVRRDSVVMRLDRMLPTGWHLRSEQPLRIPSRAEHSRARPRGDSGSDSGLLGTRHPEPPDVALVVEVADSSLDDDRNVDGARLRWRGNRHSTGSSTSSSGRLRSTLARVVLRSLVGYRHCEVYRPTKRSPS